MPPTCFGLFYIAMLWKCFEVLCSLFSLWLLAIVYHEYIYIYIFGSKRINFIVLAYPLGYCSYRSLSVTFASEIKIKSNCKI